MYSKVFVKMGRYICICYIFVQNDSVLLSKITSHAHEITQFAMNIYDLHVLHLYKLF